MARPQLEIDEKRLKFVKLLGAQPLEGFDPIEFAIQHDNKDYFMRCCEMMGVDIFVHNKKPDWIYVSTRIKNKLRGNILISVANHIMQQEDLSDYLPFTLDELAVHLTKNLKPGMSWDNRSEWHIDHKKPKHQFKFKSLKDYSFRKCWSLDNLEPLWAKENLKKGRKHV